MSWQDGEVQELTVHSRLGGPARLRVHTDLKPQGRLRVKFVDEGTPSANPLMQVPEIAEPLIHKPEAVAPIDIKHSHLLEYDTEAGRRYRLHSYTKGDSLLSLTATQ